MIGRDSETLKPVKWLKIENSETDEEDSALGISSGASSSSEFGQERFFMIFYPYFNPYDEFDQTVFQSLKII